MNSNLKHMPLIPPILTPGKQRELFKVGDYVIVRPDARNYFNDAFDEMETDFGKERKIVYIQEIGDRYNGDYEVNILNTETHSPHDLLITLEDQGGGQWFWYYRCFFLPKLAVPNYSPKKRVLEGVHFEELKKTYYFSKYNSFIITLEVNEENFNKLKEIKYAINNIFDVNIADNWVNSIYNGARLDNTYEIYIAIRSTTSIGNDTQELKLGWGPMDYLSDSTYEYSCVYPKVFTLNQIDTQSKIESILKTGGIIVPNYSPKKRILEKLNESVKDSRYFDDNDLFAIIVDKNINDLLFEDLRKNLIEIFKIEIPERLLDFANEQVMEDKFFIAIYRRGDINWTWSEYSFLNTYKSDRRFVCHNNYEFKYYEVNTKQKIMNILNTGKSTPSYEPRRKRVLENLNESLQDVLNSYYYTRYNSIIIKLDINITNEQYVELAKTMNKVFGKVVLAEDIYHYIQGYLTRSDEDECFFSINKWDVDDTSTSWDKISYLEEYIARYNIVGNIYTYNQINTQSKIESILKTGRLIPSYEPRKRVLENLNEEYEAKLRDEVSDTFYFIRYNSIIVTFDSDIERTKYDKIKELLEYSTRVELPYYSQLLRTEEQFYFVIKTDRKENKMYSGWGRISDFERENEFLESCTYPKIFNSNEVDTQSKINDILKYAQSKPSYAPKKRLLENINESFEESKNSKYFNENHWLVIIFDQDIPKNEFENIRNLLNDTFSNENNYRGILLNSDIYDAIHDQCHEDKFYIAIKYYEEENKFEMGFCYLSYLSKHMSRDNQPYKTFNSDTVNTKSKLDNLLKYGSLIPSYAPRKINRFNL